jgi:signal transduction histidine kinase/DNA-binding response OmpR family regulator
MSILQRNGKADRLLDEAASPMTKDEKVNILVVDDLPEKILAIELILEELGENVISVRSGREALRQLLVYDFAVILLDVNMPDMDGFETAALVRQRKRSAHTPIIFITAFSDEMHASQGYSLGAVDFILSPVIPDVLRTKVAVFVDLFRKSELVKRQAEERVALAREQAARVAAEEATRRSMFLAEASTALANSLDYEATLRNFLRLVVPRLADLAAVALVDEHGQICQTELVSHHPLGGASARSAPNGNALPPALAEVVRRVVASGQSETFAEMGTWPLEQADEASGEGPAWRLQAGVVLPLRARERTLGALVLAHGPSGRTSGPPDPAFAEDLAGRAAVALDNARLYRNIREADRRKNEFLAMLAHELRNPLAPIRNAVHLLRQAGTDPKHLNWAGEVIDRQVRQLVRLVDDLLDVSRITRGSITLQPEWVDLAAVVGSAVETSRPLLDGRRQTLTVTLPPERLQLHADPARLAQVLANLLNNAAKYTPEGGAVTLTAQRDAMDVVFRVHDTGLGIPAEMLSSVFDLFTQVERSLDRAQGGLGIGLTLVRRLVEMHGGNVRAYSEGSDKGSEFVVRLPLEGPDASKGSAPHPSRPPRALTSSHRIFLVDDNVDGASSLAMLLRELGHEVRVAHNGAAALEAVADFEPEVVLLDIGLPGMDGYEVARRMRSQLGLKDLLLVALTGYGQDEDRRRSREAGFNLHLVKPLDLDVLPSIFALLPTAAGSRR